MRNHLTPIRPSDDLANSIRERRRIVAHRTASGLRARRLKEDELASALTSLAGLTSRPVAELACDKAALSALRFACQRVSSLANALRHNIKLYGE